METKNIWILIRYVLNVFCLEARLHLSRQPSVIYRIILAFMKPWKLNFRIKVSCLKFLCNKINQNRPICSRFGLKARKTFQHHSFNIYKFVRIYQIKIQINADIF